MSNHSDPKCVVCGDPLTIEQARDGDEYCSEECEEEDDLGFGGEELNFQDD